MDLHQLRCFVMTAEELHFGKAAQRLNMLPAALGRRIMLLEAEIGTRLLTRTTRNVALTEDGALFLDGAKSILVQTDTLADQFRSRSRCNATMLRVGAIDSAATGLLPVLLRDFKESYPQCTVQILEDKTLRLLPRLLSGRLDIAFVRPPEPPPRDLEFLFMFHETAIVAVPSRHRLARNKQVSIHDIADEPLIVPERRSRPHSYDLTIKLFSEAGLQAKIGQIAEEKHTIVNLVAAELGVSIVPRWTSRMAVAGVRYLPLNLNGDQKANKLPLAAAWVRDSRDELRTKLLDILKHRLKFYEKQA